MKKITRNQLENLLKEITKNYDIHFDIEHCEGDQLVIYTDRRNSYLSWDEELEEFE